MLARTLAALAVVAGAVEAIVITSPSATTVWSTSVDPPAVIEWSLIPETYPPPATPVSFDDTFFDVYIRNGVGGMYSPALNLLLASNIDATKGTSLTVTDIQKFIQGPGYQLFFSDPANPNTIYCDSDVFTIGSIDAGGSPPASSEPASSSSSTTSDSASSTTASSASSSSSSSFSSVRTTTSAPSATSATSSPTSRGNGITRAPVPGGPDQQGFNLVPRGAAPRAGTSWSLVGAAAAVAAVAVVW
ncbi:hypothetical protein Rhopal_002812-T1 [Rhodotorula paludigena]|uniref:Uncharacterized protein n=1 Tax=Rhodotorula paludigena TaxID=86838 RepID=A0AAV5GHU5_9BASI|nr:hypothetical protein Rhopal_002812-T1 [Rhodotorula paludigena]